MFTLYFVLRTVVCSILTLRVRCFSESTGEELQQFDAVANFLEGTLLVILCLSYSSLFLQSSLGGYTKVIKWGQRK